jgi:nitroreductase
MDALTALHTRVSAPRLGGTSPSPSVVENMLKAALRAPDHALLRPWRFLLIDGDARLRLGDLFVKAQLADDPTLTEQLAAKARSKPLRAPLIIVVIARISTHPSVPEIEQMLSAGAAAHALMLAAHAQGIGAMWRTGGMAYHQLVNDGLGLTAEEKIVGYLYVGEVEGNTRVLQPLPIDDFVSKWSGT